MSLANIRKKTKQKQPRMMLMGNMGVGKTYFTAKTSNPIFQDLETKKEVKNV